MDGVLGACLQETKMTEGQREIRLIEQEKRETPVRSIQTVVLAVSVLKAVVYMVLAYKIFVVIRGR